MKRSVGTRIFKGAAVISLFTLVTKVLGFLQRVVIADRFGTEMDADAFTFAFGSIVFTFCILPHTLLAPFLPIFTERKQRYGEASAWQFATTVACLTVCLMGLATLGGAIGAPGLVYLASAFPSAETTRLAIRLVRIMMPSAFLMGIFWLAVLLMHAYKRFALPAFGESLNKLAVVVFMLVLYRALGIQGLAAGVVAGAATAVAVQCFGLRRELPMLRRAPRFADPDIGRLGRLMLPLLLGVVFSQVVRTVLDFWFVSQMGRGYTSSLGYAKSLTDTITLLGPFAVGVVIYPYFSDLTAQGDRFGSLRTVMASMRLLVFLFAPVSIGLMLLRSPVLRLVFERGQFGMDSVLLTSGPLFFFAMGLTAFAVEIILMRFYLSAKDTMTPILVGMGCVGVHLAVVLLLRAAMAHSSIALANTVSKTVKVAILFVLLRRKIPHLDLRRNLLFAVKTASAALLMGVVVFVAGRLVFPHVPDAGAGALARTLGLAAGLGAAGLAGLCVYAAAALLCRQEEARIVLRSLRGVLRRAPKA